MQGADLRYVGAASLSWSQWQRDLAAYYAAPNYRPATRLKHQHAARALASYGEAATPGDVDALTIAKLCQGLAAKGDRPATINSVLRCVRAQVRLLLDRGIVERDPFAVRKFRVPEDEDDYENPPHLTLSELRGVLARADVEANPAAGKAAWGGRVWRARRRRALAYLLAYTGVRRGEALRLRVEAVHATPPVGDRLFAALPDCVGIVDIRGQTKTRASRQPVPLVEPARGVVLDWIGELAGRSPYVFPQARNPAKPWSNGAVGYRPTDDLRGLGERAGVRGVTPLALRHSWATHAETAWGLSELQIQRNLRHSNARTQRGYRHADLANICSFAARIRIYEPEAG